MKWLALLLAGMPALANADTFWGSATLTSLHGETKNPMNENNPGLGLEYHTSGNMLYLAGAYRNSYSKTSVYTLAGWTPVRLGIYRIGILGGVANGYPKLNGGGPTPVVAGLLEAVQKNAGFNLILIPPALRESPFTVGLQVKFKF